MTKHSILALFETDSIRHESFQYAIELAKRMNSKLTLLVILSFDASINSSGSIEGMIQPALQAQASLEKLLASNRCADIIADIVVRIGNPQSELVKYLAETGQPEILVWGSAPNLIKRRDHWLVRMKNILAFPVVTPFIKTDETIDYV
jgi:hypothetical protein